MVRKDAWNDLKFFDLPGLDKGMTEDEMAGWHHQLPELTQTHVHRVCDAIQPSHPLSSPSLPTFNLAQHQSLSQ